MLDRMKMILSMALGRALGHMPVSLHGAAEVHNRAVDAVRETANIARLGRRIADSAARLIPRRRAKGNGYRGPNGVQAMARRVRQQISGHNAASQLWVDAQNRRWHTDSNGVHRGFCWG